MREKLFTLSHKQRDDLERRYKQTSERRISERIKRSCCWMPVRTVSRLLVSYVSTRKRSSLAPHLRALRH